MIGRIGRAMGLAAALLVQGMALAPMPGRPASESGPEAQRDGAMVRRTQVWVTTVAGKMGILVSSSAISAPSIKVERDGNRTMAFQVDVSFNPALYDPLAAALAGDDGPGPLAQSRMRRLIAPLNRYQLDLAIHDADGELIAKEPVVRRPYAANLFENITEVAPGDAVAVRHSQAFEERAPQLDGIIHNQDLSLLAEPGVIMGFVPLYRAESRVSKKVFLSLSPDDITRAKRFSLVLEAR